MKQRREYRETFVNKPKSGKSSFFFFFFLEIYTFRTWIVFSIIPHHHLERNTREEALLPD